MSPICNVEEEINTLENLRRKYKGTIYEDCSNEYHELCLKLTSKALERFMKSTKEQLVETALSRQLNELNDKLQRLERPAIPTSTPSLGGN
jgi:hypothetical protein